MGLISSIGKRIDTLTRAEITFISPYLYFTGCSLMGTAFLKENNPYFIIELAFSLLSFSGFFGLVLVYFNIEK